MKKTILLLFAFVVAFTGMAQVQIPYQELPYNVHYHWGLININIGHGKVTLSSQGDQYNATLEGNTIPWEGRIFCVSDTLNATMTPGSPFSHETVTYENGWYLKPKVMEYRSGSFVASNPANYKNIKGQGELNADSQTMEAVTITADMLGMFYYFHEIDFESMSPGQKISIPITVDGGYDQSVTVTYNGKSSYTAGGITYPTYSTTFEYTYHGNMTGYPVMAEVAMSSHIPVLLSAELAIGHVEMIYEE
ncbi:MAG: DUF3108 domain-containing protein [Muribaculaceae bacterium]|nr:DUF3108 domain-containing protein [Muribaculaceae bacterium]